MINTLGSIDDNTTTTTTVTAATTARATASLRYDETTLFWIEAMTTDIETLWGEIRGLKDSAETHHKESRLVIDVILIRLSGSVCSYNIFVQG